MPLKFTKMHGLGNDYVFIGLFDRTVQNPAELARAISDRHRGVGSDGLILVGPPDEPGAMGDLSPPGQAAPCPTDPGPPGLTSAHVRMHVFNADGSRAQMCGNGVCCLAKLAYERGWTRRNPMRVQTDAGVLTLDLTLDANDHVAAVRVDVGQPILEPKRIPVATSGSRAVGLPVPLRDQVLSATCVSMGNPHAVFFVPDLKRVPLGEWGPQLERHPLFPQRINVHFVQVVKPDRVKMITWERGSGITQACGTGACAVCVAGVLNQLTDRAITAELPGGELQLAWDEASNHVSMTGPAVEVFTGEWPG